tara:strand:- start:106 stop:384 length:279 start_codon:yes stop_codon:yes gene_type:complete
MRKGFKHGKVVREAVPHADINKVIDKGTGKEDDRKGNRSRVEGSTLEFKKSKNQKRIMEQQATSRTEARHGGRMCAQIKGFGKARRPKKKYS